MERVITDAEDDPRMGSEYSDARTYLSRSPRKPRLAVVARKEPAHGSNDSIIGLDGLAGDATDRR